MGSKLYMKMALLLGLVVYISGNPTKSTERKQPEKVEFSLPSEGLVMDILVSNRETHQPMAKVKIDINEQNKKVMLSLSPEPPPTVTPTFENRHGIVVGTCPKGYTRSGGFCFKEDYDY